MSNTSNPNEYDMKYGSPPVSQGLHNDFIELPSVPKFRFVKFNQRSQSVGLSRAPPQLRLKRNHAIETQERDNLSKSTSYNEPSTWKVAELNTPPDDYIVARTSRFVKGTLLSTICTRIVQVLKKIGVVAQYDSVHAVANCETFNFTKMDICLYSGRGDFSNGIIVEVRRKSRGSGMEFMNDCRSILDAAEGKQPFDKKWTPDTSVSDMKCLDSCGDIFYNKLSYVTEALDLSEKYLKCDCSIDVKMLGLNSLNSLLDHKVCTCSTVVKVCQSILVGKSNEGIQRALVSFLERTTDKNINNETSQKCRSLALIIIQKAFHAAQSMCIDACCLALSENPWLLETLIPLLVSEVKNVDECPRNALISLRCLNDITPISIAVMNKAQEYGFLEACEGSKKFGERCCDTTLHESNIALNILSRC